ncbi:MAG TPA: hypothetical protein VGN72_23610 [Tepidisphaeraceae bacterium]|jgi:hypothetical protein|nr:hypothetical protein [Tepidisphaeraceae bacterium]
MPNDNSYDAPYDPAPQNPPTNSGDQRTEPPTITPLVTEKGAIDTSGMPPTDASGLPASRTIGHEQYEVGLRGIFKAMAWLVAVLIVVDIVVYVTMFGFINNEAETDAPRSALASDPTQRMLPPEPRLQPSRGHESTDDQDWIFLDNAYKAALDNYGWVDEKNGVARIPVDQAMEKVLADPKMLPARAGGEPPAR